MPKHLSALSELLTFDPNITSTIFYERVLFYVIVACRRKLVRRIKHPILSKPFMQSLDAIKKTVTFADDLIEQPDPSVSSDERKHDLKFLEFLLAAQTIGGSEIKKHAPLLCELARAVQKDENHPFQLYTEKHVKNIMMYSWKPCTNSNLPRQIVGTPKRQYFTVPHLYVRNPWNLADSMDFRGLSWTFVKNEN